VAVLAELNYSVVPEIATMPSDFQGGNAMAALALKMMENTEHAAEILRDGIDQPTARDKNFVKTIVLFFRRQLDVLEEALRTQDEEHALSGFSPSEAQSIARSLSVSVKLFTHVLDKIDKSPYAAENPTWDLREKLEPLDKKARALARLSSLPIPSFDPERVQKGLEQAQRGEGRDAEELLAQLKHGGV
jgi:hypothetical protein